jgi:hypothetical protein
MFLLPSISKRVRTTTRNGQIQLKMGHAIATCFELTLIRNTEHPYLLQPIDQNSRLKPAVTDSDDASSCFEIQEHRVPRIKTHGAVHGIDLERDMRVLLSKAGNTVLEAVTFRRAGDSTPWVRIRRTSWYHHEVSPSPSAVYEMCVAQLDELFEQRLARSVDSVWNLIHRKTDEAWLHIEHKILRAGIGARDTWREGWMRPDPHPAAKTAQYGDRPAPVASRKLRRLPF